MNTKHVRDLAWIGDAVLALFAREWLLKKAPDSDFTRQELFIHFTSNSFLNIFAEPTVAEAEIGKIYQKDGLQSAFDYIEKEFVPIFLKQIKNKRKRKRALN